jgi:hypothetical protein
MVIFLKLVRTHTCEKRSPHSDARLRCSQTLYYTSAPKTDLAPALLGSPPGLHSSPDSTNSVQVWLDRSCSAATPSPMPILDPEVKLPPPVLSVYDHLLEEAGEGRWPICREDEYILLTAQSPLHLGENQRTLAWITTHLGITRAAIISDNAKLGLGSPIQLHDTALVQRHDGFESPWLFGILEHILRREPHYYIFAMKPHLFTITKDPYPIYCSVVHVTVINHFLANDIVIPRISELSLGQRMEAGMSYLMPPHRPWEMDWTWRHREHDQIMK